jgi:hypothetical protein
MPSSFIPTLSPRPGARHAEDSGLHLSETIDVVAHPRAGVVEEERLGEAHGRIAELGRLDGSLIGSGADVS